VVKTAYTDASEFFYNIRMITVPYALIPSLVAVEVSTENCLRRSEAVAVKLNVLPQLPHKCGNRVSAFSPNRNERNLIIDQARKEGFQSLVGPREDAKSCRTSHEHSEPFIFVISGPGVSACPLAILVSRLRRVFTLLDNNNVGPERIKQVSF
jgi:hypothetical protein